MVQLVPPVMGKAVDIIERNLTNMESISIMLEKNMPPEEIAMMALEGLGAEVLDSWEAVYHCDCSRERTERVLISMGRKEIEKLAAEQQKTEVCCHFCNKKYEFSTDEMLNLLKE